MVDVLDDAELGEENLSRLKRFLEKLTAYCELDPAKELCVRVVDSLTMQALNFEYSGNNSTTDVLSFPADGDGFPQPEMILGDLAVCLPVIAENASENNIPLESELYWAVTHGFLHLLGWEHPTDDAHEKMEKRTNELLSQCGVEVNNVR
ncbi:rRNA maturation RNase YbeY [bacterium]|nr:rRNA maturation RNase YbeY [bacterium]